VIRNTAAGLPGKRSTYQSGCALRGIINNLIGASMKSRPTGFSPKRFSSTKRLFPLILLIVSFTLISHHSAYCADVTLAWDANSEADLAGYKLHYGIASGVYNQTVVVGNVTEHTVTGLNENTVYYFAATAYDMDDNESDYSNEVSYSVPGTQPSNNSPNTPQAPSGAASGYVSISYAFTTTGTDPDGDDLEFRFDWGDGTISSWGAASRSHSWSSTGTYYIKAQSRDSQGATSNWSGNHTLAILTNSNTITASAGTGGSISPSGSVSVTNGSSRTFTMTANQNYRVANVLVDGASVGAVSSYTFSNVTANHAISVSFSANTHTITASAGSGGSISPSGSVSVTNGSSRTFTMTANQNYTVANVLADGASVGAVSSYTFTNVTANHAIQAYFERDNGIPIANAGTDQTVHVNDTVQLDGGLSSDPDNDMLTYEWSFVSKPQNAYVYLNNANAVNPSFTVSVAGTYIVSLKVNDGSAYSNPDTVRISTENSAPVANAGANQTVKVNETVQLNGNRSSDVDGDALAFSWSFYSKPAGSEAVLSNSGVINPTFKADVAGTYRVRLTVNDGDLDSESDTVRISTENSPPVADAGEDQSAKINDIVHLNGDGSSDVDGDTLHYNWSLLSAPVESTSVLINSDTVNPTFEIDAPGNYSIQLTVNDGSSDSEPDTVILSTTNSRPVANAGSDQSAKVGDIVQLDGSSSYDVDGDTLTCRWSLVSTPAGSTSVIMNNRLVNPLLTLDVSGTYVVQLIVNDGYAFSKPDTITISTENTAPVANAGKDQHVKILDTVALTGSGSYDADGDSLSYRWSMTTKPNNSSATLTGADTMGPSFICDVAGSYIIQLIVTDGKISSQPDVITITAVNTEANSAPVANAGSDQKAGINNSVQLNGNESYDMDGDSLTYKWSFTFVPNGSMVRFSNARDGNPTFVPDLPGTYIARLVVSDGQMNSSPDTVAITADFEQQDNHVPDQPVYLFPENGETGVPLTPVLTTDAFYDQDADTHLKTQWQVDRIDDDVRVLDVASTISLTSLSVPRLVLEPNTSYVWRVRFIDSLGAVSNWSDEAVFTTGGNANDGNDNGVPDSQEIQKSLDLDQDSFDDKTQSDMKCIAVEGQDGQLGVSIKGDSRIRSITALEFEDPDSIPGAADALGDSVSLPYGLIHFKLVLNNPGDEVTVTIYLSEAADQNGKWYKYNPVNEEWTDYSDYTEFSNDRKTVYLTLQDGGFGDGDGIKNGMIIDPIAFGVDTTPADDGSDVSAASDGGEGGGGGGCFIQTTARPYLFVPLFIQGQHVTNHIATGILALFSMLLVLAVAGKLKFIRK